MARLYAHGSRTPGPGDRLNLGSAADIDDMSVTAGNYLLVLQSARLSEATDNCYLVSKSGTNSGFELLAGGNVANGSATKGHPRVLIFTSGNRYDVQTSTTDAMGIGVHELVGFQHNGAGDITIYRGPIQSTVAASTSLNTVSAGTGTIASDAANDLLLGNCGRADLPFSGDMQWTCLYKRNTAFTITEVNTIRAAMVQAMGGDIPGAVTAMKTVSGYKRLVYQKPDATISASTAIDYAPGSPTNVGTGFTGTAPGTDYSPVGPATQFALVATPTASITTGGQFTPVPVVEIRDANGNRTTSTLAVTASIRAGDGSLTGTTTVNAVNGQATFTGLGITDGNGGTDEIQFTVATLSGFVSFTVTVDTSQVTPPATFDVTRNNANFGGTARVCNTAADLTAALAACVDGDTILLAPGATFTGQFTLRNRGTTGWVEIRTNISIATLDAACPQGTRMTPATAAALNLATISANTNTGGIISAFSARGYRITALKIQDAGNAVNGLVRFGDPNMTQDSQICSYMIADRCYFRNSGNQNVRKAILASCQYWGCVDSYVENMVDGNGDSQALTYYGCSGPFVIRNNRLEAWSEGIILGGGNSGLASTNINSVPSDGIIEDNYFTRDVSKKGSGSPYVNEKNGIETKDIRRCIIRRNVVERTWSEAQVGMCCLVKSDNMVTPRPLSGSQDIEIYGNWFRDVGSGFQIAANPDNVPSQINQANRIKFHNNLIERINQGAFTGIARPIELDGPLRDIYIDHNTIVKLNGGGQPGVQLDSQAIATNVVFRSNILQEGQYGAKAGGLAKGTASIAGCLNPYTWTKNLMVGGNASDYPPTTLATASDSTVGFTDLAGGGVGYKLAASSPFKNAGHDGADIGIADVDAFFANLNTALTGVSGGGSTPPASPFPASLAMVRQPAGFVSGVAGTTQPQVKVLDQNGALYTAAPVTITATIVTGAGTIIAGASATTSGGTATFSGLAATATFTTPLAFTFSSTVGAQSVTSDTITLTVPDVPAPPSTQPTLALTFDWGLADPSLRMETIAQGRAVGAARTLIPDLQDAPADAVLQAAIAELIYSASVPRHGTKAQRPAADTVPRTMYFDDTLGKPIWSDGVAWRDATGALV